MAKRAKDDIVVQARRNDLDCNLVCSKCEHLKGLSIGGGTLVDTNKNSKYQKRIPAILRGLRYYLDKHGIVEFKCAKTGDFNVTLTLPEQNRKK